AWGLHRRQSDPGQLGPGRVPGGQERTGQSGPALSRVRLGPVSPLPQAPVARPEAPGLQKKVVSWIDVYARATCQPREVVVPLTVELMGTMAKQLVPSCVTLQRCGGCCPDDGLECVPTGQHQVRMQILMIRYPSSQLGEMSLEEHSRCECRCRQAPLLSFRRTSFGGAGRGGTPTSGKTLPSRPRHVASPPRASTPRHRPQPRSVRGWDSVPGAPSPADITHPTPAPGPSAHAAPSAASALTPGPASAVADAAASSVAKGGA
ncbi:Vascular endothelial growth factor B, partial [Galemys pyrenaicus]